MYKDWKFWAALGAGAITGAVFALLYAPTDCEEMRRRVGQMATNVADGARGAAGRVAEAAQSGVTVYGASAKSARFQIERLFKAVTAGVEEASRVRADYIKKYGPGN